MSVVKDHLRLLEYDTMIVIVSRFSNATQAEMVHNVARFTLKPVQHVAFQPPCCGRDKKAHMLQNVARFTPA